MKTREELKKYLSGEGIEIGALQNPLDISGLPIKKIRYVDRLSVSDLRKHYPELNDLPLVDPDVLDDGQKLENIESDSLDFIIANHLIEHVDSPLSALENWSKRLREDGILFMAVPDKRFTFDKERPLTPLSHLVEDHAASGAERNSRDFEHFFEWTKIIGKKDEVTAENEAKKLHEEKYSIHYHVWTYDSFIEVLRHAIDKMKLPFEILDYSAPLPGSNEFIFILRKTSPVDPASGKITDVVIPVFNGYSFFCDCFESIIANTKKGTYRVIVVDDCSHEKEILKYFEEIKKIYPDSLDILRNEENLGFVKSVNRGMQCDAERDVILLNSDTVVTKDWLPKIKACAGKSEKIATVTPLTNSGTICSVPKWLEENKLPDGFSIDSYAALVEKAAKKELLELPTAVGFCMLIKREVLKKIGFFDEESYGKGYGEENDFSMRAKKHGYKNVLDEATFIYHKGHMSFSADDFQELTQKNAKILHERYPTYEKEVSEFIAKKPLAGIIERLESATKKFREDNILYFIHQDPYTKIGGSEKHILDMVSIFQNHFSFVYLLYFEENKLFLERISRSKGRETILLLPLDYLSDAKNEFEVSELNRIFEDILKLYQIKIVHFQHILNLPLSLIKTAEKTAEKVFFTAHDYYLYCSRPHLLKDRLKQIKCLKSDCGDCSDEDIDFEKISARRRKINEFLDALDKVIFPSDYIRNNFCRFFPEQKGKFVTVPHPYLIHAKNSPSRQKDLSAKKKLNVAFLGYFSKHKGSEIFREFVQKNIGRFNFFILGSVEDQASFEKIRGAATQFEYSSYRELEKLVLSNDIDVAFLLSIVPESFSFTLTESLLLGIPLVASNIGAFSERLQNNSKHELFSLDDLSQEKTVFNLAKAIEKLAQKSKKEPKAASSFDLDEYNEKVVKQYLDIYKS